MDAKMEDTLLMVKTIKTKKNYVENQNSDLNQIRKLDYIDQNTNFKNFR
jgi:hypothetical protein